MLSDACLPVETLSSATEAQRIAVPGQRLAAAVAARLAEQLMALDSEHATCTPSQPRPDAA
jgi:hypothetical protein